MTHGWLAESASSIPGEVIESARTLEASTIYEANDQQGALDPAIRTMTPGLKLCGNAFTVRCQPGDNLAIHAAVAHASAGDVIVVDVGNFSDAGHWGEILTVAAISRGVAGLVINGGVRDVAALAARGFPVFARGASMKSTTKTMLGLVNHPITCGGVTIHPGDLIVADDDGVVAIAHGRVGYVLGRAKERESAEAQIMRRLGDGDTTIDLLGLRPLLNMAGEK